jgi:hypothetical protein
MRLLIAVATLLFLALVQSSALGQKKTHKDDYLNNEIVTIKGKVTVFILREGNEPGVGNQQGLIFQRVDCKKCFLYTQADCDGNYKIRVSRGKYRVVARYGNRIGEMVDILAPSQKRIIDGISARDVEFDIRIVLPFQPLALPEGLEIKTQCNKPDSRVPLTSQ